MARTAAGWRKHYTPHIAAKIWSRYYPFSTFHEQTSDVQQKFIAGMHLKYTIHSYGVKGGLQKGHKWAKCEHVSQRYYAFLHNDVHWDHSEQEWQWWEGERWSTPPVDKVLDRNKRT